jgi:hypothetical protein
LADIPKVDQVSDVRSGLKSTNFTQQGGGVAIRDDRIDGGGALDVGRAQAPPTDENSKSTLNHSKEFKLL